MKLTEKKCVPCEEGAPPLRENEIQSYLSQLKSEWEVLEQQRIRKEFGFEDFKELMVFVNKVADIAEQEQHHPDLHIHYNKLVIEIWTHSVGGLSENDFILAAKINELLKE